MKKLYPKIKISMLALFVGMFFSSNIFAGIIISQPRNVTECEGSATVSFSIGVSTKGYTNVSYQWQYLPYRTTIWKNVTSDMGLGSERTTKLVLEFNKLNPLTTALNKTQFRCVVTATPLLSKPITEYSTAAYLYVNTRPSIYSQPSSATKNVGESVSFSVGASGATSYQWQKNYANIPGATSSSYSIASVTEADESSYRCVVANSCGTSNSLAGILTVNPLPDFPDGWSKQVSGTDKTIRRIDALNDLKAAAVISSATDIIKITSDGGETWSTLNTGTSQYWYSIAYPATNRIVVAGYNYINITTDGGTTWTPTYFYTTMGLTASSAVYDIEFVDANTGYACGMNGLIMKTTDGGVSWTLLNFTNSIPYVTDAILYDIHFLSATTGWIVGESGVILKTADGGATWTKTTKANYIQGISFGDANNGIAVGSSYRYVLRTTNGGATWDAIDPLNIPYIYPYSVTHTGPLSAYIVGLKYVNSTQYGTILKTIDGGVSWKEQWTDEVNTLNDIIFVDSDNGWAVGNNGEIQRTGSGGCLTPTVDLYTDQAFCATGNRWMVADSFSTNLNCSYQWYKDGIPTSTNGSLSANQTGVYSIEVTSLCGVTAKDTLNIFVFDLPVVVASSDVAICDGDTTQLNASGADTYLWSNGSYLNNNSIQNPLASPPAGLATQFTVTGTDLNGCVNTDNVTVTVNYIPDAVIDAPAFVCGNQTAVIKHLGTSGINNFHWSFEDSLTSTGTTTGNTTVSWEATNIGSKNISLVVDKLGCTSDTATAQLEVRVVPTASFTAPVAVCSNEAAELVYTGTAPPSATYNWSTPGGSLTGSGQGPVSVTYSTEGTKTLGLEVVQAECSSGTNQMDIIASYPYNEEEICLVTVDLETGKNMVIWEKTPDAGIAEYRVYTESTVGGIYNIIGTVPYDSLSVFVDLTSEPEKKQNLYKIKVVDTCGYESDYSPYHKTMFLQYVSSDNGVNLTWQEYKVEGGSISFDSYIIYRGSDSTNLAELETISSSLNAYTDTDVDALSQRMYYRVGGVKTTACDPAGLLTKKAGSGPFVHSLSNLEDNRMAVGVTDHLAQSLNLRLYPNPFNTQTLLSYNLKKDSNVRIELYNIIGDRVYIIENNRQYAGDHSFEINAADLNHHEGLYYIRLFINDESITRKVILRK
ncbi:MAG: T9SS type A sorting domain-containing protein [Bacteroidales bacterium]|nr:T9SS type A sorting domain-containing protein [Bacteroidales bacterium]